jgi:cysteinyl-tRNA synthetase
MSTKYLGKTFDIHGGGIDLMFPHHESEICQSRVANDCPSAKYWVHNNMITINGQKMGKSLGNFITLNEFFSGKNEALQQAYSPMNIRFFILQAHYRSTLDFSNEALQSAQKGLERLMQAYHHLQSLKPSANSTVQTEGFFARCQEAMDDDLNTAMVIAELFEMSKMINAVRDGKEKMTQQDIDRCRNTFETFAFQILGLKDETESDQSAIVGGLMEMILEIRQNAKAQKDWCTSDKIRDRLNALGISVKDGKEGATWDLMG